MQQLIVVKVGKGQWTHASVKGSGVTLCGKKKNVSGSSEDSVTCMKCLEQCKYMPVSPGA